MIHRDATGIAPGALVANLDRGFLEESRAPQQPPFPSGANRSSLASLSLSSAVARKALG